MTDDTRVLFEQRRRRGRWSRWRWALISVLVVALAGGLGWLVYFSSVLAVADVEVQGTSVLAVDEVRAVAGVPEGRPLARVDLDAIERRVESMSAVRDAEVSRAWPDGIRIEVDERVAIAVVSTDDRFRALDAEGVTFRDLDAPPDDLPLVELGEEAGSEAVLEASRVVAAMPQRTAARVASISVASVDEITLELRDGATVLWGSASDSDDKAEVLDVLLAQGLEVSEYDVSVPGRPTTR
ncbi:FtsQ-type POTRA domain-containing protein [Nocardioides zeae]|uniref:Cell division protein FtsQ n=1 Tax=Nocardioides imazamoxiresistens TaxID=3231893 RepID=A0ABU3PZA6_9ACTN|nr:FtsQ-type POTRA domain-containing protein [Nocardioides zeae]MDT9594511.1 FtsQ-type POTRA domain-containing protein [Nocardioides zeae]